LSQKAIEPSRQRKRQVNSGRDGVAVEMLEQRPAVLGRPVLEAQVKPG
jgi:hypothetical protein